MEVLYENQHLFSEPPTPNQNDTAPTSYVDIAKTIGWMFAGGTLNRLGNFLAMVWTGENNGNGTITIADDNKLISGIVARTIDDAAFAITDANNLISGILAITVRDAAGLVGALIGWRRIVAYR